MLMRSLVLFCLFIRVAGADSLDICSCPEMSGQISCTSHRSVSLLRTCAREAQVLRVQGDGFVAEVNFNDDKFRKVLLEKTTLTCMEGWVHFPNATRLVFNGVTCRRANRTTSKPTTTTKEPKPRPPAHPQDDEENEDDKTANNTTVPMVTNSTVSTTTRRAIIVTSATLGNWWVFVAIGVVVTGTVVIIVIRIRWSRRRSAPIQDGTVSSTSTDMDHRSFVLREVPRSPRRRGGSSQESVTLFAVDE